MSPAVPLPPEPQPPDPMDCCGGGCAVCVFDAYEQNLADWREAVQRLQRAAADVASPP